MSRCSAGVGTASIDGCTVEGCILGWREEPYPVFFGLINQLIPLFYNLHLLLKELVEACLFFFSLICMEMCGDGGVNEICRREGIR